MVRIDWKIGVAAAGLLLAGAGCNGAQRDSALRVVRSMQQSGTAEAAVLPDPAPLQGTPPTTPPPGTPPTSPPATPPPATPSSPAAAKPADGKAAPAAPGDKPTDKPAEAKAKTPDEIIGSFMKSDPRDILVEKKQLLKEKETKPWDETNPDTFIPETGRKDPMTPVRNSMPKELLPPRTGDENSDLVTYLLTQAATDVMTNITENLKCYSVIQIGLTKYVRLSFDDGKTIQTISQQRQPQSQRIRTREGVLRIDFGIDSITPDEVVINVSVTGEDTKVSVQKQVVFIPRTFS